MELKQKIVNLTTREVTYLFGYNNYLRITLIIFGLTFLTLFLLTPFQFHDMEFGLRMTMASVHGLVSVISAFLGHQLVIFLCPIEKNAWTLAKELLVLHLAIFFGVIFLFIEAHFFCFMKFNGENNLLQLIWVTYLVGIVCYLPLRHYLRANYYKSLSLNTKQLSAEKVQIQILDKKKNIYCFERNDLIYIESFGNYLKIHTSAKCTHQSQLVLHMTLTALSTQISMESAFFRCHRSYIINLDKVERVEGGVRNTKAYLRENHIIPVSREKISELKKILQDRL